MKIHHALTLALGFNLFAALTASAVSIDSGLIQQNAYDTTHFSIEFSNLILDQTDEDNNGLPDMVDTIAEAAEYSRGVVIDDLNYPDPMENYDRKLLIILDDRGEYLSTGAMGVTSLLSNGDPYIAIDPWMAESDLQVTVGHEYFHTVQFGYDDGFAYSDQGANWAEATATWMEDQEYDSNDDYVNYLPEFFDYVDYSVFASIVPSDTLFQYGAAIWPHFLSEYYDTGVIKDIWEAYVDSSTSYYDDRKLYNAVDDVVDSEGDDLTTVFRDFTLWNLDLSEYQEGDAYPQVYTLDGDTDAGYQEINHDYAPALFGTNYIYFDNVDGEASFYFHVLKPDGVGFAVTLIPYDAGSVDLSKKVAVILDQDEELSEVMELNGLRNTDGVYAVVSPLDIDFSATDHLTDFDEGYLYDFFADYAAANQDYSEVVDSAGSSSASTDDKSGVNATEVDGGGKLPDALTLTVVNYDEDSVNFSWNRLTDSDIASYEVRYGTKSGKYTDEVVVSHAYTTVAIVSNLEAGTKYYFELVALDSSGDEVGDPSMEISVTPEEWVFSDVSFLDDHYEAIAALTDAGVFNGYSDGSFKPEGSINRAELLKILVEGQGVSPNASTYKNCFTDVSTQWFSPYVCYAKTQGWVMGYSDGSFRPGNSVNKVEALKMLLQVYEAGVEDGVSSSGLPYPDLNQTAWYASYVQAASELGILEESPSSAFEASNSRTRGEMAEELYRYLVIEGLIKE